MDITILICAIALDFSGNTGNLAGKSACKVRI